MRVEVEDPAHLSGLVGFLQQARCIAVPNGDSRIDVFLAHDLPPGLAEAELTAYLSIWHRITPGGRARLVPGA